MNSSNLTLENFSTKISKPWMMMMMMIIMVIDDDYFPTKPCDQQIIQDVFPCPIAISALCTHYLPGFSDIIFSYYPSFLSHA